MSDERRDEELLIEAVTSAWRPEGRDGIEFHPAWYDLEAQGRERAFDETSRLRQMEAALDIENLSTTARAVLDRIHRRAG